MKPVFTTATFAVLVGVGVWIGVQFRTISGLERENDALRKRLAVVARGGAAPAGRSSRPKTALERKPVDWGRVAVELRGSRSPGGYWWNGDWIGGLDSTLLLKEQFASMSREELIAGLDDLEGADMGEEGRKALEARLFELLAKKDPEYALKRFIHRLQEDESWTDRLVDAFAGWSKKEPGRAIGWFDGEIAGKSIRSHRIDFEAAAISSFLLSDLDLARRRFSSLPANMREGIFGEDSFGRKWREMGLGGADVVVGYAELVRQLPEKSHFGRLSLIVCDLGECYRPMGISAIQHDLKPSPGCGSLPFAALENYLDRIDATPAEREACILAVARARSFEKISGTGSKIIEADLDTLRIWTGIHAPELTDRATAAVLERMIYWGKSEDYVRWAEYALQLHGRGGGDDLLRPFLERVPADQTPFARSIAGKLSDEAERAKYLEKLK